MNTVKVKRSDFCCKMVGEINNEAVAFAYNHRRAGHHSGNEKKNDFLLIYYFIWYMILTKEMHYFWITFINVKLFTLAFS